MMEEAADVAGGNNENKTRHRSRRVNYFTALVEPILRSHSALEEPVAFMSGTQVERIMYVRLQRSGLGCGMPHVDDDYVVLAWGVECITSTTTTSYDADINLCR